MTSVEISITSEQLVELGVRIEEAKTGLEDACVYLERLCKTDDLAVAELLITNVKALRSRYMSWASVKFGLGLNDAIQEAVRKGRGAQS